MQLTSADFTAGGAIPTRYTCEGENVSPEFSWKEVPSQTKSFALIVHDPDAPRRGGFTHWVLYNIPGDKGGINPEVPTEGVVPGTGIQGCNGGGQIGYTGPCPPSGMHHYHVKLFALDTELELEPGATQDQLIAAIDGHILGRAELVGTYQRQAERAA